jgi:hypothetical protein
MVAADAAGCLDVLGTGLGLTERDHQAEPGNIETDGDHVGRNRNVGTVFLAEWQRQAAFGFGNLGRAHSARELDRLVIDLAILEESLGFANPSPVGIGRQAIADFVFDQASGTAEFAQAIELAE